IGPLAERHRVMLVIEPLNSSECNFITSLADGAQAVTSANHPHVRLLADTFHMLMDGEPPDEITRCAHLLKHVHVAEHAQRGWPGRAHEDLQPFYTALKKCGYSGDISIECIWENLARDAEVSCRFLREELGRAGF